MICASYSSASCSAIGSAVDWKGELQHFQLSADRPRGLPHPVADTITTQRKQSKSESAPNGLFCTVAFSRRRKLERRQLDDMHRLAA
jgi:hypothetical protein